MSNNADVGKVFNIVSDYGGDGSLRLESIAVTKQPDKIVYKSGETFDPTGMVVTGTYTFDLTSDVTGYTVSPTVLTDGVTEVTITYTEGRVTKTASTPVTVEKVLTSIEVTTPPSKTSYNYLESFDPAGMVVTARFSDGSTAPATGFTCPDTAFSTLGSQPVNIGYTYEGVNKETVLSVTVVAVSVPVPTQNGTLTFDGSSQSPTWDNYDSVKMTMSGDTHGIHAGSNYETIFTLAYGYVFPDGKSETTVGWAIERAVIASAPTQKNVPAADGSVKTPEWDGYDPTKMTIRGDQSGIAAGDYTATFTPTANYQWWDGTTGAKSVTWTITSIIVTTPTQKNIPTYDGAAKTPEWDNFDQDHSTVTVTPATDAGEHEATFTLLKGMWDDGTTGTKTVKWRINRASIAAVPTQSGTLTYNGNPQTPTWDATYETAKMTLSVEPKTLAGTNYTATFTPTANYQWWDGTTGAKSVTWTIERATIAGTPSQSGTLTYNGSAQSPSWSNYSSTSTTLSVTAQTNAGTYSATFTPKDNYMWSDKTTTAKTANWTIGLATISTVPSQSGSLTYNGNAQSPTWSNYDSAKMTLGGTTSSTNAGTFAATFTPKSNYKWSDNSTTAKTVNWTMAKAAGSLSLSVTSVALNSSAISKAVTVTRAGNGTITATSNNTSVATVSVSGTTLTIKSVNSASGTATITVKVAAGTNHNAPSNKTIAVTATFLPASGDELENYSWKDISNVAAAGLGSSYWAIGDRKSVLINGTVGTKTFNSTYSVYIIGFNHNGSKNTIDFGTFWGKIDNNSNNSLLCLGDNYYKNGSEGDETKVFSMNHGVKSSAGGWKACDLRYDILGSTNVKGGDATTTTATNPIANTLMAALPSELRAVMKPMTIYTDNVGDLVGTAACVTATVDYLPLLADFEIWGTEKYFVANTSERNYQKQYTYYASGNSKTRYVQNAYDISTTRQYGDNWTRSPSCNINGYFCLHGCYYDFSSYSVYNSQGHSLAYLSLGIAPIFRV